MRQDTDPGASSPTSGDGAEEASLPELLKQAAALTASTDSQLALFNVMAQAKALPSSASAPKPMSADKLNPDDLPALLKQLQDEATKAVSALSATTASLGL